MLRWALTGADAGKVTTTGNTAYDLSAVYETGKETVLNKADRINNVYDLEGNGREWTVEANSIDYRVTRGGCYNSGSSAPSKRENANPNSATGYRCSRPVLYIK